MKPTILSLLIITLFSCGPFTYQQYKNEHIKLHEKNVEDLKQTQEQINVVYHHLQEYVNRQEEWGIRNYWTLFLDKIHANEARGNVYLASMINNGKTMPSILGYGNTMAQIWTTVLLQEADMMKSIDHSEYVEMTRILTEIKSIVDKSLEKMIMYAESYLQSCK